jgi:serine/threonine protein phosphatase PrpC
MSSPGYGSPRRDVPELAFGRHAAAPVEPPPTTPPLDAGRFEAPAPPPAAGPPPADPPAPGWVGEFQTVPFSVGDPGRAAMVPGKPDPDAWSRPDTVLDGLVIAGPGRKPAMDLRAASVRGRSHRFAGKTRQDGYAYRTDGRYLVAAVADGVSSGPLSHLAADITADRGCALITHLLRDAPPEEIDWTRVLQELAARVERVGRQELTKTHPDPQQIDLRAVAAHMSSTVVFAVVDLQPRNRAHMVHLMALGDSAAWILRSGSRWEPQHAVKNDGAEIASSVTRAVPLVPDHGVTAVRALLALDDVLVLITDGIGDPLGDGTGAVGAFLAQRWGRPPLTALEFGAHVDFARRSHDDDRTALALWPTRPASNIN